MKSKVRSTLLFVVLFVLAVSALFAAPPVFTAANITAVPASGALGIGSTITVTVVDVNNISVPATQFVSAAVDFSEFGGPASLAMSKISNAPAQGQWRVTYTVQLGIIDGVANRRFTVSATNADGTTSVINPTGYTVDNVPSMNDSDITGTPRLRINDVNTAELMKVGDTVYLIANVRTYIETVWIDWGATFVGGLELPYQVVGGVVTAAYTPPSGTLLLNYNPDLSIKISKMQSITNGAAGPYMSAGAWFKNVSKNQSGFPIAADLNPPNMMGAWDLYYDNTSLLTNTLRFSPTATLLDGYATAPNTFDIYLKLPDWGVLGGSTQFKLKFATEGRLEFTKTYSIVDAPASVTNLGGGILRVTWDGKNNSGVIINPTLATTVGITLTEVSDWVGNLASLTLVAGGEFPYNGDMNLAADQAAIYQGGGLAHVGNAIINRIHVVVDNIAPTYVQNLILNDPLDASLVRLINDSNNNTVWDPGEVVYYNNSSGAAADQFVNFKFKTERQYTVDTNPLRHETQKFWVVAEKLGAAPTTKWYWTGANWAPIAGFNQVTDGINVPFTANSAISNEVMVAWDLGNISTTIFTGAVAPGVSYTLTAYVQDSAGNITKSQLINLNITHVFMNIPIVSAINITSEHVTAPGGLPAITGGVKNFYLTAAYDAGDLPYTGNYYVTQDQLTFEIEVNNRNYLRATNSVEFRFNLLGITAPQVRYIDRAAFGANNKATITVPANIIPITSGTLAGKLWTIGGANNPADYIQVISHAIQYVVNGAPFDQEFPATGADAFNLVIPPKPDFPNTNWAVYNLAASNPVFSPGNPLNTYDAATNPAYDGFKDISNLSFTIPDGSNLGWRLVITDGATTVRSWTGHLGVGATPYNSGAITFNGLNSATAPAVGALATKALTTTLYIEPDPMGDPGYLPPPASIYPNIPLTIDNTNPALVSGTGTSIDSTRKITLTSGVPVVTETQNTLQFTVYTSEALTTDYAGANGWKLLVRNQDNTPVMNGAATVAATITNVTASADFKTFNITASFSNLAGTLTNPNTILIVRLPWDSASNPARYNLPEYPYNADVWHYDSAEYYLTLHILDAKPKIEQITFSHRGVTGMATYAAGNWNTAVDQSWVGPTIASPAAAQTFTMVATVSGGAYRAMHTDWTADLRPLLGTAAANAAVVPTSAVSGAGPNESLIWTLTWTGTIPAAISTAFVNNAVLSIPITIVTADATMPLTAHTEIKSIDVKVDKAAPVASIGLSTFTADGTARPYNLTVTDTNGSGVYYDTVVANPYNFVGESLVLSPNTGMTLTDVGDATYNLTIPTATAVKYFQATYTVIDKMGNSVTYNRYLNVQPIPVISNVTINAGAAYFVPGNNVTVTWDLANFQRATTITVALSAPGVSLASYTTTIAAGFTGSMTYTFNNVNLANLALDGKLITATVSGTTTGYTAPTASATSPINLISGTDTIQADVKPVINSVIFKLNGNTINTLVPTMSGITIEVVATTTNNLNTTTNPMTINMISPTGTLTGFFNLPANPGIVANGTTRTYTWTGVSFTNLAWTPYDDVKVARFNVDCQTIYGYAAAQYMHDMAVLKNPVSLIQGKTGRVAYNGTDPNGWFAPEHFLHTEYTFVTTVNRTAAPVIPPVKANFDQIEDDIATNWLDPVAVGSGSTKTAIPQSLVRGTSTGSTITATVYKYMAKWVVQPDVQSVWSAYADGAAAPINFDYEQMTATIDAANPLVQNVGDIRTIQVDKKVPKYDNQLWIATGTTTPGSYQPLQNGFPGASTPISVALNPQTGTWTAGQKIYLKYTAMDGSGAGALNVVSPATPQGGWTIAEYSHTVNANGTVDKVISLTPVTPGNINSLSTLDVTLSTAQDAVGHVNYGPPTNSTDPDWVATPPVVHFNFRADYATTHQYIRAYKYWGVNTPAGRQDWHTAPYVKTGDPIGVMLKLNPVVPDRGTDVSSIVVDNVKLNCRWVTSATGGTVDDYVTMEYNAVDDVYYLNTDRLVAAAYIHGAGISMQYQINYIINYTGVTAPSTAQYVSGVLQNVGIVDKEAPQFIFNGSSTNPLNQRSVFIWSGSIGASQEGYVVPGDNDGVLKVIFKDNSGYENTNTAPDVKVIGLNSFVTGMPATYTVPASMLTHYANYSLNVRNTTYTYTDVWVASLDNLPIYAQVPPIFSKEIDYQITDVVGNGPITGDRFVEIAANGPIVPIIRHAEVVTTLPGTGTQVVNYLAQGVPATMKVYIDTEYSAYIEDVWTDAVTGVAYGAKSVPVAIDPLDPNNHGGRWLVTIPITPTAVNSYTNINFSVHTKRNPFGGTMFTGTFPVPVIVDGKDYAIGATTVTGVSVYMQTPGMISPQAGAVVTAQFNNIGELIVDNNVVALPAAIQSWFTLQNTTPAAFTNIPTPTLVITGNDVVATWTFVAADINQALATNVSQLAINFKYKNIWGFEKTSANVSFNIDKVAPVISTNGIKFYTGANLTQTSSYNASNYIANNQNWTKVRFDLNDPDLRVGVVGSGINNATVVLNREAETFTPTPDPLANMTATVLTNGYIELAFNAGFSAFALAEGYYNFTITTKDNLQNGATYIQRLLYWHQPAQMQIVPNNLATVNVLTNGQVTQQQITAFPYDPNGQVQAVQFALYQDVNNNSTYQSAIDTDRTTDLINSTDGNPDHVAPYTVMWNLNKDHYKYKVDAVYGRNATRKFLVRASALSEGTRAVSDSIVVINVVDNQPPVPNEPTYSGNTTFNYVTPANNTINLAATFDAVWTDAEWGIFEIRKNGTLIQTINSLIVAGVADTTWNYNGQTPGDFVVSVKGKDFVGNISAAVTMTLPITINNPASLITYNLGMTNVLGFNNEPAILNGTVYGTNNPAAAVGELRLDAQFRNINTNLASLEGISAITFKARVTNNITGVVTTVNVPNNTTLQPDYPAIGAIPVTPQMWNNTVSIFVPDSFYMPAGYNSSDFSYDFFIELTPTNPAVLQAAVYSTIRLDYFAPRVAITENTPNITWSQGNFFKVTGDITDITTITMQWSKDNTLWHNAVSAAPVFNTVINTTHYVQFNNWNTAGGSENTLLDYAGTAWVKVIATDALGNERTSVAVMPFVDNVAPKTPVTHVAYRTHPDVEAGSPAGAYNNLHALGALPGETNNTITVVTSTEDYGTSNLRIYLDPAQITNLSGQALTDANFNNFAPWVTGNPANDFRPPVRLYHGYSATGNLNNIVWTPGMLYDHEPMNGMYGFDIPSTTIQASGTHYFILGANDTRGNVEGDMANAGLPTPLTFDGLLTDAEMLAAIDLTVNVVNVADVEVSIVSHTDNQIVGEWQNLAANITSNAGNVTVNNVIFQRKNGNNWVDIATVPASASSNVKFHLYRKDIPQFDGLPYVPGVHLYANGTLVNELMWDAASESWSYTANLAQGTYNFKYRLDLNNDGIINANDATIGVALGTGYEINDPNGFTSFTVTPWVTSINTELIAAGLYEFRAMPVTGTQTFNQIAPSRWLQIDNQAPNTAITLIGGVTRVRPYVNPANAGDPVTIVADVNDLLVALDDVVTVTYQYSSQPPAVASYLRRWNNITPSQSNMAGNYRLTWTAPNPLTDLIDNNNNGLVDEAAEADAQYYLRAVACDKAGNYFTSNVYNLFVDGSAPLMIVDHLNGIVMNSTNNIFTIPANGIVTVTANNITPTNFDVPVAVHFEYQYRTSATGAWSAWASFDPLNIWVPIVTGVSASQLLPMVAEGYYGFRATSKDALGNIDANPMVTYVIFNDVNGTNAHITSVGTPPRQVISNEYAFAQAYTAYNGAINVTIDNPANINTVTFEWAAAAAGPWTNINTVATNGQANVTTNWTAPVITPVPNPYIYLRIVAQDIYGNNESTETVKLYVDTTAPGATVVSLTHTVVPVYLQKVLNQNANIDIVLSYTNLPVAGLIDLAGATVRIIKTDGSKVALDTKAFTIVNSPAGNTFQISIANMLAAGFDDGIYRLEIELTDFAGNASAIILPAAYQVLYIDTKAPENLAITSTTHPNNIAVYNTDNITFAVDYTDLIGVAPTGALNATFTYMNATQTVTTYTLDAVNHKIMFVWNPSAAFEQYITNGAMDIVVSAEVKVKDLLGQESIVPNTAYFFTLTYGVPNTTRIMAVTDYYVNLNEDPLIPGDEFLPQNHFVDWNLATPQVVEMIGTNQTIVTDPLNPPVRMPVELYAYVAHQSEIPAGGVEFFYQKNAADPWTSIGTDLVGQQWQFVHPGFLMQYQREYSIQWNVYSLSTGTYKVKTVSHHVSGDSESIIDVHIYNDALVPSFAVTGMINNQVERGETYPLTLNQAAPFNAHGEFASGVVYKYRYLNPANNSPISSWMYFGDVNGTYQDEWIQAADNFSFDWTVYPFYLFNNRVQIVAHAIDRWGSETPIPNVLPNAQIANIINVTAPAVTVVTPKWNGIENPVLISGNVNPAATIKTTINTSATPEDLVSVKFYYKFNTDADFVLFDTKTGFTPAQMANNLSLESVSFVIPTNPAVVSGVLRVVTTDLFGNTNASTKNITIENTLPTATLVVTQNGTVLTNSIERGTTVVLNANPADAPAGVLKVAYAYAKAVVAPALPVWINLSTVTAVPWTYEWAVPANLEFGATYLVKATVTDAITANQGNTFTTPERSFTVTDHITDIVINSVNGILPVNHTIVPRLHGNIPVQVTVNELSIPRVEYMVRQIAVPTWTSVIVVPVVGNDASTTMGILLDAMADGAYYLGVRAHDASRIYPVMADSVKFTLDNTIGITVNSSVPATNGYFNGDSFAVSLHVDSDDEIVEGGITLEYAYPVNPTVWIPLANAAIVTPNGMNYVATYTNVMLPVDGRYNFRIKVMDAAVPDANVAKVSAATNVLFDSGKPIANMVSINGETDLTMPVDIELGTVAPIVASAYDVVGGQIHVIASDIAKVEFYDGTNMIGEVMFNAANPNTYTFNWNTLGFVINTTHQISAIAYDNAGNTSIPMAPYTVNIVAPQSLQPYAIITAMDFDPLMANSDDIYAVVKNWPGIGTLSVAFEYFNGTAWLPFTQATDMTGYWHAVFNAELMTGVTKLRAVINGNYEAPMPELAVNYSAADGGSLIATNPAIQAAVYYKNQVRVVESFPSTPIVTTIFNGTYKGAAEPYMMNGNQTVDIQINHTVAQPGKYTYWAATLDNSGNVQLTNTILNTYNAGTVTDNGIAITAPAAGYVYFQNVMPTMTLPAGFTSISAQHAVFAKLIASPNATINSNLIVATTPTGPGTTVAMWYDEVAGAWSTPITVTDNMNGTVSFNAPTGHIIVVAQYTGVTINAMFSSITPQYIAPNSTTWTKDNPLIKFFVYEGMDANGAYILPQTLSNVQLFLDNVPVAPTAAYNNVTGIIGYQASALTAGTHTVRLLVTQNGFTATVIKTFSVDTTVPVITAVGSQLTQSVRTISASIVDAETGIDTVALTVGTISVPMSSLTVTGNTYAYQLTDEDLFTLGYNFSTTMPLSVSWAANNHLPNMQGIASAAYTVNIVAPGIVFTGFANGWWINPTANTPITFNVIAPTGRTIQDNISVHIEELINDPINGNYSNTIQTMSLNPISVNGNVYSYSFNFGYAVAPNAHAVSVSVSATDSYNVAATSNQTYGIDYLAPVVWALAPVGAPINPDTFPVVYESAVLPFGTNVALGVGFQDIQGFTTLETGEWWYDAVAGTWYNDYLVYYTGASGVTGNAANVVVTLDGTTVTNGTITNGSFTANAGLVPAGNHTVIATVKDNAGNVGSLSYNFTVVGGAPTIAFNPLTGGGWWLNSTTDNTLGFSVTTQNTLATGGVVANIYTVPGNVLLQGPITPTPTGTQYSISLLGGVIPADQTGIRMEVCATDVWGGTSTSAQVYGIDNNAPAITIHTPVAGTEFTYGATVSITATINDQTPGRAAVSNILSAAKNRTGSGLATVTLKVTNPAGTVTTTNITTDTIAETLTANMYGTYQISVTAIDIAGNQSVAGSNFIVPAAAPTITFNPLTGGDWWINSTNANTLSFTVEASGINLAAAGVIANVYCTPSNILLQGPITPTPVAGVYNIVVQGGVIPADQTGIRLEVIATNVLGGTSTSNQVYGIDNNTPGITITSPAENAQFVMGATVNILANITDSFGTKANGLLSAQIASRMDRAGSGIQSVKLTVMAPDGSYAFDPITYPANTQVIMKSIPAAQYGVYLINITATDGAENQAMASREFMVTNTVGPTIEIDDIVGGWLNSVGINNLGFTVTSPENVTVTNITAKVYTYPSEALLMGPLNVNPVASGVYSVNLNGSMIPADQTSVRLNVLATDQFGNVSEANRYYSVDKYAPAITILSPAEGAQVTLVDESTKVRIEAQFSDMAAMLKNTSGSGIDRSYMVVIDPLGMQAYAQSDTTGLLEIAHDLSNLILGTYIARVTVWDNAGNQAQASVTFTMIATPLPPVALEITEAHAYPNPMTTETGASFSVSLSSAANVNVRIYDFAGREVRSLENAGTTVGKGKLVIGFDGCNNDGVKLARGTYFARVIANDGKKIVEKIVKIAIKK